MNIFLVKILSKELAVRAPADSMFAVVIPAFNEEKSIASVVEMASCFGLPIVVDDGSSDGTRRLAEMAGAIVVSHPCNRGYDQALQTGLFKAIDLGCVYAVTMDGDSQHDSRDLPAFKAALLQGADLVIGVRDQYQRVSETVFAFVSSVLWSIDDPLCGMKGYRLCHVARLGFLDSYGSIGTEYAIRSARAGLKLASVPIVSRKRNGQSTFGVGVKANLKIFRALALGLLRR